MPSSHNSRPWRRGQPLAAGVGGGQVLDTNLVVILDTNLVVILDTNLVVILDTNLVVILGTNLVVMPAGGLDAAGSVFPAGKLIPRLLRSPPFSAFG